MWGCPRRTDNQRGVTAQAKRSAGAGQPPATPAERIFSAAMLTTATTRHEFKASSQLAAAQQGTTRNLLSRRERQILSMLANGMNGPSISRELMISSETVRTHVRNAMRKLAARTRVHAVTLALQRHEISLH